MRAADALPGFNPPRSTLDLLRSPYFEFKGNSGQVKWSGALQSYFNMMNKVKVAQCCAFLEASKLLINVYVCSITVKFGSMDKQ